MSTNWFDQLSLTIDVNKKKIQWSLYAIACSGLVYAVKSVRPFKKFYNSSEIPKTFIDRRIKLNGKVIAIDYETTLLRVDHNPVFNLRFRKKNTSGIGVQILGINVTSNGLAWLDHTVINKCIHFTLLKKYDNRVGCIVDLERVNIAEELLKLGFATVDVMEFDLENDKLYVKYYKRLLSLEEKAEKQSVGIWASEELNSKRKVSTFPIKLVKKLVSIFHKLYYRIRK